jgi:hypothetical protein
MVDGIKLVNVKIWANFKKKSKQERNPENSLPIIKPVRNL